MRLLGLDIGDKKIGIAVSDELGFTAQGIGIIVRTSDKDDIKKILDYVESYGVEKVIAGLPKNMNGTEGPQSELVRSFCEKLKKSLKVDLEYWDERLTTVAAEKVLISADVSRKKRKGVIDKIAAALILQSYLNYTSR